VVIFGGCIGKYKMSKFLTLCEKVQKTLLEQDVTPAPIPVTNPEGEQAEAQGAATTTNLDGQEVAQPQASAIKPVTPEDMITAIERLSNYLQNKLGSNDTVVAALKNIDLSQGKTKEEKSDAIIRKLMEIDVLNPQAAPNSPDVLPKEEEDTFES
jgi:hypothetical protein